MYVLATSAHCLVSFPTIIWKILFIPASALIRERSNSLAPPSSKAASSLLSYLTPLFSISNDMAQSLCLPTPARNQKTKHYAIINQAQCYSIQHSTLTFLEGGQKITILLLHIHVWCTHTCMYVKSYQKLQKWWGQTKIVGAYDTWAPTSQYWTLLHKF